MVSGAARSLPWKPRSCARAMAAPSQGASPAPSSRWPTPRLALLDFGATRAYAAERVEAYRRLLAGGMRQDLAVLDAAAAELGYFQQGIRDDHRRMVLDIFLLACEPLRQQGAYDFGRSSLAARMRDAGMRLGYDRDFWHTPPIDALFLHRKIGGLYLLAARLGARVDIRTLFLQHA